jgi:tetratricopeptide (TPR) repeat protein
LPDRSTNSALVPVAASRWPERWLLAALLVALTAAVYWPVARFEFLTWDDDIHVTANPHFQPLSWSGVGSFWTRPFENLYIPASYSFFSLEAYGSELLHGAGEPGHIGAAFDPRVFHIGNLVLHVGCVLLVFWLLIALVGDSLASFMGALLFSLHPLQVESVAWISETRGLLSALFSLAALLLYVQYVRQPSPAGEAEAPAASRPRLFYCLATCALVLALLSKPSAVAVPLMAAAIDCLWLKRRLAASARSLAPWFALSLAIALLTKSLQADQRLSFVPPLGARFFIAGDALAFYLSKLFVPLELGFDYGRMPARVSAGPWFFASWLLPGAGLALLLCLKNRTMWLTAAGVSLAALLPVLGFSPFLYQDISTVADRYMYLAMLGVSLALAYWLAQPNALAKLALCGLCLGIFARIDLQQAQYWRDDLAMYNHGLAVNPDSYVAHFSLGMLYQRAGRNDEARAHYEAALQINPKYSRARNNLGIVLFERGKLSEAVAQYREALKIAPDFAEAHMSLGNALLAQGHRDEARREYREALRINPDLAEAHINLADALLATGELTEAFKHVKQALLIKPDMPQAYFRLGEIQIQFGRTGEAERAFREALRRDPTLAQAHANLAAILFSQDRLKEAGAECDAALALDPALAEARFNKGCVLLKQQQVQSALEQFREALRYVPPDSPQARYMEGEIKKYAGK